jgi:hypothetical protein
VQVGFRVDRDDVEVGVGDLHPGDDQADPCRGEGQLLGLADALRHGHQVGGEVAVEVDPVVDLGDGHHEGVAAAERGDREEGHAVLVAPDEPAGQLTVDDAGEDRGHRRRLGSAP